MKKFNILWVEGASFDEVQDSISDVLEAGIIIEEELKDGFQIEDLLAVIQVQDDIREVIKDAPIFFEQFTKLTGQTAVAAVLGARSRILAQGKEFGKVTSFIIRLLFMLATSYGFVSEVYLKGRDQFLLIQTFLQGGEIFPIEN